MLIQKVSLVEKTEGSVPKKNHSVKIHLNLFTNNIENNAIFELMFQLINFVCST